MTGFMRQKPDPGSRLLDDISNTTASRMHVEKDSGTETYRQLSKKEMQNPILKRVASGPQNQRSRRSANGYMPVRSASMEAIRC
jgi:hypothetical protein